MRQYLLGLLVGELAAGLLLTLLLYPVGTLVAIALPSAGRRLLLIAILTLLGTLDLLGRTPHLERQTPQRLAAQLSPGPLGLLYGLDIGFVVTTQKSSSLLYAAFLGVAVWDAPLLPAVAVVVAVVNVAATAVQALAIKRVLDWEGIAGFSVLEIQRGLTILAGFTALLSAVSLLSGQHGP
jgi:hypothetical protein